MTKLHRQSDEYLVFYCPGCKSSHRVRVAGNESVWGWNGNMDAPTFSPSILVRSGHYDPSSSSSQKGICWCTYNRDHLNEPAPFVCTQCHSFVRDGMIQFLPDCSHELAGKTVSIPEWEETK